VSPEHDPLALPALSGEAGFTLVELLVTVVVGLAVFTAAMQLLVVGAHKQRDVADRADQLNQARVAVDGLVRDLRHGSSVTVSNTQTVSFTPPGGTSITFGCSSATQTCSRGTRSVITGVTNTDVFSTQVNAQGQVYYLGIKMVVSTSGRPSCTSTPAACSITLTDGVALRNVTLGQ
jgi:prepilin-type N-terminal cleavage/methylation domain-containing protein